MMKRNSSEEALLQRRRQCGIVKNPKRRFRFTANPTKRSEAEAMRKAIQEMLRVVALLFIQGLDVKKLNLQGGVEDVANTLATSTTNGISKTDDELKRRREIYGINWFTKAQQAWKAWKPYFSLPLPLSISLSLSIPLNLLLPFVPSISLLYLDLSPMISCLFPTSQQDTSSSSSASPSSSSPEPLPCCPSSSQEHFVHHMRPSLTIAPPTAAEVELGYKLKNLSSGCGDRKFMRESFVQNKFGDVKSKNSSEAALQQQQRACIFVKNPRRRLRFAANQTKRSEAEAMRKTNQEKLRDSVPLEFLQGHDVKKLNLQGGVEDVANTLATSTTNGISKTDDELKRRREIYGINWFTKAQVRTSMPQPRRSQSLRRRLLNS